jgi:hypothetical protein
MRGMTRLAVFFISLVALLSAGGAQAQDVTGDLLGRINNLRASVGLPGYQINGALTAAAQSQAQWMADTATVSHTRPDGSGPRTRAVNAGYGTTDVTENIYGGTNANVSDAWAFWVNSATHYRGLVNSRYQEVGIGAARSSWGATYVLVFGNPGGPAPFVPQTAGAASGSAGSNAPPSYVVGVDPRGFIMHEIQPEDTLGDIALIYGYTWDDIPYMKEINDLVDHRSLQVGEIFLVPPHDGTYTPTPGADSPESQADTEPTSEPSAASPTPTATPTTQPSPAPLIIATAAAMPEVIALAVVPSPTPQVVAAVPTQPVLASSTIKIGGPSPWLTVAVALQVGLLVVAVFEFIRRKR